MVFCEGELSHTELLKFVLVSDIVVMHVLIVIANGCDVKELDIVRESNPETTIVDLLQIYLLLRALSPLGRLVAPVSLPLFLTPGVTDLD